MLLLTASNLQECANTLLIGLGGKRESRRSVFLAGIDLCAMIEQAANDAQTAFPGCQHESRLTRLVVGIDCRAVIDKIMDCAHAALPSRQHQSAFAAEIARFIDIGASREQQTHNRQPVLSGRAYQGSLVVFLHAFYVPVVTGIGVRSMIEQKP